MMRNDSPVSKVSLKLMKIQRTNLTSLVIGIPIFIAKLSERQYCWRVFEDFHSQEYIQFFDIHNCLFVRLHFSIGVEVMKTFRVSSLFSAAEQRRLFAMHFALRSSGNSSRWKRKTVTDRRKRKK